ncbi:MAG: hypothetical protein AAF702_10175 [Chloroflexota bacterium]
MSIFKRILNFFSGSGSSSNDRLLTVYAMAHRSRSLVSGTVDLYNELSLADGEDSDGFYVRKVLHTTGENRVFDQVEIELWFDPRKKLDHYEVIGGRWLEPEEYTQEVERRRQAAAESESEHQEAGEPDSESGTESTSDSGSE